MAQRDEHVDEPKKGTMSTKKIMVIVTASVLVSTALIAGVLMYVLNGRGVTTAEAQNGGKAEHAVKKAAPVIYPLEPFIVNIHDGQDYRYLKVKVEFETNAGPEPKAELDPYLAPIRDAILVLLSTKTLQDVSDLPGKNRLRDEVLAAASKVVPPGKINRVYFTDFVVQ